MLTAAIEMIGTPRFKVTTMHLELILSVKIAFRSFGVGALEFKMTGPFLALEFKVMEVHQFKTMAKHQLLMTTSYLRMVNLAAIDDASMYLHNILCNDAIAKIP